MPTKHAHLVVVRANGETIEHLRKDADKHLPWIVTVAFYKALHMGEALLSEDPEAPEHHTDDHKQRNTLLKKTNRYKKIWEMYRELYQASLIARYLRSETGAKPFDDFSKYMSRETVETRVLGHFLLQIEKSICSLLKDDEFFEALDT